MKPILWGFVALVLLSSLLWLALRPALLAVGGALVVEDDLQPVDVIHVISGPNYRIDYSVQLYQQGYGKQLFYTGRGTQTYIQKRRAVRQGVPQEAIVTDGSWVTSTYSEALRLQALIVQREGSGSPIRSVIVTSDAYHMRRARWAYRQVLGDQVRLQMAPVPLEASPYRREWWTHPRSREHVRDEYLKLAYYYARYKLFRGPIRSWLASLDRN